MSADGSQSVPDEVESLRSALAVLEAEVAALRRRLNDAPRRMRQLEERLLETKGLLAQETEKNEKLSHALRGARENIASLRDEVDKLSQPPSAYGVVVGKNDDGTVDVLTSGRKMRVNLHPDIDVDTLARGAEVVLNESFNVVTARSPEGAGDVVSIKEVLDDGVRAIVVGRTDEEIVCELADSLRGVHLRSGDTVRLDPRSHLLLEKLPRPEIEDLLLEEVPDISYSDIGGLDSQIEQIADAVELPFLYQDLFAEHALPAPKGILLYGPPGCGKTLIAKAVANSLAKKVASKTGDEKGRSYFINIKGPELLNKYVGETERQIRLVFQRAREKSEEGWPVIVFFDEMDSMFRTRGTGISSDMESTIVPQLLAEIDGVEGLRNVIVIGATNREDLIDPAILRPGRLDVKIKIERPTEAAARQIFARYLTTDIPIDADEVSSSGDPELAVSRMIDATVESMYRTDEENRFLEVTYANGDKEVLFYRDFSSGAMIENVVRRAKKLAIKRVIAGGSRGVRTQDLLDSIRQEFREHEDLPNTTNPDDWAKISGKKGERIVFIRTLVNEGRSSLGVAGGRAIERSATGQYL
ncbi:MAG: proteasome ATPase [Acidimicrobiia bacterium]|jgi:proteasome-associated ATPase|nr:proteasome ATPase [Actinomycetota bacterium]NDE58061.1 proteasome ATPase [Acidimicrobiia bacterium]NDE80274.1 proteasome ATPase [Actinomycetota bacterium]